MLYMLAAGLVMAPDGFADKYYADTLNLEPGWIPLCRDTTVLPAAAVERSISERNYLVPCIASFDLQGFTGSARVLPRRGKPRDNAKLPQRQSKSDFLVLVRAPLPLNLLTQIIFRSAADRQAFETAAADVANVDLKGVELQVDAARFDCDTKVKLPTPPRKAELPGFSVRERAIDTQTIGGALAMLYHTANRSDFGTALYRFAAGRAPTNNASDMASNPFFAGLPEWLARGAVPTPSTGAATPSMAAAQIYWSVVRALTDARREANRQPPTDIALEQLNRESASAPDDKTRALIAALSDAMRGCLGLGGGTVTELFRHHRGQLSRSLLLFCLREHCIDLLEFSHPALSDEDYASAAILFGVRDGWIRMPQELRPLELSAFVSSRMAEAMHAAWGDGVSFGTLDPVAPLREFFLAPEGQWTERQANMALGLARRCNWFDCIRTLVMLAPGEYPPTFPRDGLRLALPGEATVRIEADQPKFMECIGQRLPPDPSLANKLRAQVQHELSL
jgi:hypothetical protein